MEKKGLIVLIGAIALVVVGSVSVIGYQQGWLGTPYLTVELTSQWPDGRPLPKASVTAAGKDQGLTDSEGKLSFRIRASAGEEVEVSAKFSKPGMEFEPWKESFVVRKVDSSDPDSARYPLAAVLKPKSISAIVEVLAGDEPVSGARIQIGNKTKGKTDSDGALTISLGSRSARSGRMSVRAKGYKNWSRKVKLQGGDTYSVQLQKVGAISGKLLIGYESLGRVVPVSGVEASLGGRRIGKTNGSGRISFTLPSKTSTLTVKKEGYIAPVAETKIRGGASRSVTVPLFPEAAPVYRIAVLPPRNGSPGNPKAQDVITEVEDRLADYLSSYGCFERVNTKAFMKAMRASKRSPETVIDRGFAGTRMANLADAVVASEVSVADDMVLSVDVVSVGGKRLGAFAETDRVSRLRRIARDAAKEITELFPFEGHVTAIEGDRIETSLSSAGDRGARRGQDVRLYRWNGSSSAKLTSLGKGKLRRVTRSGSEIKLDSGGTQVAIGDKVVLMPRAKEASFSATLDLTLMAGAEGSEIPFGDVNVYRDGTWVGLTDADGRLRVPVESGGSHLFLFRKSGVKPHSEKIGTGKGTQAKTVILPSTITRLRIESKPSGARVIVDGREIGTTPLEAQVMMGFRHVQIQGAEEFRMYDQVLEFTSVEENYTGSRAIVLEKNVLAESAELVAQGKLDDAIRVLERVDTDHPDYSAAHNRLGGIFLDERKNADRAIEEFEKVLALPANKKLVNKRFTVTFLNLGRAYYAKATPESYEKAIANLEIARNNKRFFPRDNYDLAIHDTLYFLALSSHKLYNHSPNDKLLQDTSRRWKDYFDFFPPSLQDDQNVQTARAGAEQFYEQIRREDEK